MKKNFVVICNKVEKWFSDQDQACEYYANVYKIANNLVMKNKDGKLLAKKLKD